MPKRGAARPPGPAYWLITRNENGRIEVLTIHLGEGEEALALFSFEEEAQMYLGFEASGDGWRTRETRAGELVLVLFGLCAHVGCVTLDPLPQVVADETVGLLGLDRKSFVRDLLDESELKGATARRLRTRRRKGSPFDAISYGILDVEEVGNGLPPQRFSAPVVSSGGKGGLLNVGHDRS